MLQANFTPTDEQYREIGKIFALLTNSSKPVLTLCGAAGTGKTSMMFFLAQMMREASWSVGWLAPTGKAAARLAEKTGEEVSTIHSMIYRSVRADSRGELHFDDVKELPGLSKIWVCDEASMVDGEIGRDLRKAVRDGGGRLLYVGDREQLPPVRGSWDADFEDPDGLLEQVHRQAMDSPILRIATDLREKRISSLPRGRVGEDYSYIQGSFTDAAVWMKEHIDEDSALLCYTNKDRKRLNRMTRHYLDWNDGPVLREGERIVVLSNNPVHQVMNGEVLKLNSVGPSPMHEGQPNSDSIVELGWGGKRNSQRAMVHLDTLGANRGDFNAVLGHGAARRAWLHADHGYALTVHKMQGSEAKHIGLVFSDGAAWAVAKQRSEAKKRGGVSRDDLRRWIYTALTRSQQTFTAFDTRRG